MTAYQIETKKGEHCIVAYYHDERVVIFRGSEKDCREAFKTLKRKGGQWRSGMNSKPKASSGVAASSTMVGDAAAARRRAHEGRWGGQWCDKHGPIIKSYTEHAVAIMDRQKKRDDR